MVILVVILSRNNFSNQMIFNDVTVFQPPRGDRIHLIDPKLYTLKTFAFIIQVKRHWYWYPRPTDRWPEQRPGNGFSGKAESLP